MDRRALLICLFLAVAARASTVDGTPPAEPLPGVAPSEPAEALGSFRTRPGFQIELVVSEPLVRDPVAIDFDQQGRMYVVELPAYNQYAVEEEFTGRGVVKLVTDSDADGVFDASSVYVDDLDYPTAVACYDGGIFVGAAPDLLYCKDHDGDGQAEERRVVFTGFGVDNAGELHLNSIRWGLDNRFYLSTSGAGGDVRAVGVDNSPARSVKSQVFVFDPRDPVRFELTSGGGQHGMSFDDWGRRFVCSNRVPFELLMYDSWYLERNPYVAARGAAIRLFPGDEQPKLFRISPPEPWRVARTRIRAASEKGDYEGGQPFGFFTASTGVTVYRGDAWPEEYRGSILVGEPANNLVYRARTETDGLSLIARRADQKSEFVASTDIWFRPVQFANAPDGTLYVLDMYRELIEGAAFIPPEVLQQLDVVGGVERGRIYRVVTNDHESGPLPDLSQLDTAALVALLEHPNGWHRDTASRLLYERQDPWAHVALEQLARQSQQPLGRLHALFALDGMHALTPETLLPRLDGAQPEIRRHVVRLAERVLDSSPTVRSRLASMTDDSELIVRYQLAVTLGELPEPERSHGLAALALRDRGNEWIELAIRSSAVESAGTLLALLADDLEYARSDVGLAMMGSLAVQIGKQQRPADIAAVGRLFSALADRQTPLLRALVRELGLQRGAVVSERLNAATDGSFRRVVDTLLSAATSTAIDDQQPVERRVSPIRMLELGELADRISVFTKLLDPTQPLEVRIQAVASLGSFSTTSGPRLLVEHWTSLTPRVRS